MGLPNQHCKDPAVPLYIDKPFCRVNAHGCCNARANALVRVPPPSSLIDPHATLCSRHVELSGCSSFLSALTWVNFTVFICTQTHTHTFVSTSARQPCNGLKRNTKQMVFQLAALLMLTEHVIQASERKRKSLSQIYAGVEGHGQHGKCRFDRMTSEEVMDAQIHLYLNKNYMFIH